MKFAINMCTYKRKNGTTLEKIKKTINSVLCQSYNDWKLFLIGDHYEDEQEFNLITNLLPKDKITYENLSFANERESGKFFGNSLWCCGGVNAINQSIKKSINEGFDILCHLDDDDEWLPYHLEILKIAYTNFNETSFVYTNSYYVDRTKKAKLYPETDVSKLIDYNNLPPKAECLVHSSASWKFSKIPLFYRDTIEQKRIYPADADLWERIGIHNTQNNLKSIYMPITTVKKHNEGEILG